MFDDVCEILYGLFIELALCEILCEFGCEIGDEMIEHFN
jgi:hypothetical protein